MGKGEAISGAKKDSDNIILIIIGGGLFQWLQHYVLIKLDLHIL